MSEQRIAESVANKIGPPDGGRRLRTPEFYWGRAKALRQLAADNRGLALNYRWIAKGCDDQANNAEQQADLMEEWANQAEAERQYDGSFVDRSGEETTNNGSAAGEDFGDSGVGEPGGGGDGAQS